MESKALYKGLSNASRSCIDECWIQKWSCMPRLLLLRNFFMELLSLVTCFQKMLKACLS